MLRRPATGLLVVAVTVGMLGAAIRGVAGRPGTGTAGPLLAEVFTRPDGLITNEHASWSPSDPAAVVSGTWRVTSGSLFADGNNAWTGVPDDRQPDAGSAHGTGSAVFRLVTRRTDLGDVQVSLRLRNLGLVSTARTPPAAWDGVHLFLRYQSQYQLYYASVNRRDATVLVKKKCPGGSENGGTYYLLGSPVGDQPIRFGAWQRLAASVRTNLDGVGQHRHPAQRRAPHARAGPRPGLRPDPPARRGRPAGRQRPVPVRRLHRDPCIGRWVTAARTRTVSRDAPQLVAAAQPHKGPTDSFGSTYVAGRNTSSRKSR
jgi:hypothetical protein